MGISSGLAAFKLAYQLSPIILSGGIAQAVPGGMLPIIAITEAINFAEGLLSGGDNSNLDNFFANFQPMPGGTLISNKIGTYPFANQATAANATIAQPLAISMMMISPVRDPLGYAAKLATMMALRATLAQHASLGGTYIVVTPSFFYVDCILLDLRDVSSGQSKQVQMAWQWDFAKPLLTLTDAQQAQNSLMSKISSGTGFNGPPAWSGLAPTVGNPSSVAAAGVIPAATGAPGAGTSPPPLNW